MSGVSFADAADERATPSFSKRQNAEKIPEAAGEAVRAVVVLRVSVTELAGGGDKRVVASLNVDGCVDPGVFARQLNFLGGPLFPRGRLRRTPILRGLPGRYFVWCRV